MQVFKVFFKVLNKHKLTLCIYIVIYLLISIAISSSTQESGRQEFSKVSLSIAVENQDQGELGAALVSYLEQQNRIQELPPGRQALQDAMYYQEIDYVLVIPDDFTERFQEGKGEELLEGTTVPGSRASALIENEIQQYLTTASMYLAAGIEPEYAWQLAAEDMKQSAQVEFLEENDNQSLPNGYYFFQYIPYVFLVLMILGLGAVMKTFRDKDLSARNKCSATSFLWQNVQIMMGCVLFTLGVCMIFIVMAYLLEGQYMYTISGLLSAVNALIFSICAAGVAWFCAQIAKNGQELNAMSNIFGLSFSFLGGVFVPLGLMSSSVQKVAKFIPSYWYVVANEEIQKIGSLEEAGEIYQYFGMVLMFALAFFAAGLLVNRMKQRLA